MPGRFDGGRGGSVACRGNASFRGRGCLYPSFLSQVTKGHQARLPLRGARGGGTRGGGPRRLLPGRSGRGPAPEEERRLGLEGPLTAGDSWQARGPRGGSVLGCPVRDPGRLQSKFWPNEKDAPPFRSLLPRRAACCPGGRWARRADRVSHFPRAPHFCRAGCRQLLRDAPWPRCLPWTQEAGVPGPVWGRRSLRWRMSGPGGGA
ncbi:uncharacterized protein LOC121102370 [Ursus maritimus]|uniref:Uncharacterized protein LOC121102369 n=1 Tax=Ursus maritimus TaxID=29073 RepID=A0A8M1FKZ6_URSMA|nr:uncharacterized protein LOC121102369 [Ursus maritimus]XP_040484056.1 uncharacterized protein LOC121102370 [Ursus maritimus]